MTFALINIAVTMLPIGTAMILLQTNPLWVAILACLFLKERVRLIEIAGILIGFSGVVIIAVSKTGEPD